MQLVLPSREYKEAYRKALEESKDEIGETLLHKPEKNQSFEDFIQQLNNNAKGINLPEGWVQATTFWLIDNKEVIGRVQIRHELNEFLLKHAGHIGYYIRPSKRKLGYGKKILGLALVEAKKIGLQSVLLICDDDNTASLKIIEDSGGVLEDITENDGLKERCYWITFSK